MNDHLWAASLCHRNARLLRIVFLIGLIVAFLLLADSTFAQCALCKESLKSGGTDGLIRGFAWSIVLLISTPILLVGAITTGIVRSMRRQRLAAESSQP